MTNDHLPLVGGPHARVPILLSRAAAAALATSAVLAVATPNAGAAPAGAAPAGAAPSIDGRRAADAPVQVGAALATGWRDASRGTSTAQRKRALARKRAAARRRAKSRAAKRGRRQSNLTVADALAELRQLRLRPAGDARAPWTTVDISGWDLHLDDTAGGGASSSPGRAPGAGATAPASKPSSSTLRSAGGPKWQGRLPTHSERWAERSGGPRVWAFIPRDDDADTSTVSIVCRPRNHGRPLAGPDQAALDAGRANLASLPIGPQLDGRDTRIVRYVGETAKGRKVVGPPVTTYYLDASTGVPLRQTYAPFETEIAIQTDFSLWEEQPAGGSADQLSGTVPRRFRLQEQRACADATAPTSPAATTPPG